MLKMLARGERDGKPIRLIVLGLSHANLDKLRDGLPIGFNGATVGIEEDLEFLIFSGRNERSMQQQFAQFVGPDTKVDINSRLKD